MLHQQMQQIVEVSSLLRPRPVENGYNGGKSKGKGKSKAIRDFMGLLVTVLLMHLLVLLVRAGERKRRQG